MYLVINKCVTAVKVSDFSGHYLHNRSTLDIGVSGYISIVQHKEHSPEVLSIPPGTPCIQYCDNFCGSHCAHDSTGGFPFLVNVQQCENFGDNHCTSHNDRGIIA